MGSIYLGLTSADGYVFVTNDIFGQDAEECAIYRLNDHTGALLVTTRGRFLPKVKKLFDDTLKQMNLVHGDPSENFIPTFLKSLKGCFGSDPIYQTSPLPFLLLVVGCRPGKGNSFAHTFVRHRVLGRDVESGHTRYTTGFDLHAPKPAADLFYGHSGLGEFLRKGVAHATLDLECTQILGVYSLLQSQRVDGSIAQGLRMATLSFRNGFQWVSNDRLASFVALAEQVDHTLRDRVSGDFVAPENFFSDPGILKR